VPIRLADNLGVYALFTIPAMFLGIEEPGHDTTFGHSMLNGSTKILSRRLSSVVA
jgi:hypothetical protein